MELPRPIRTGGVSLARALAARRSERAFLRAPLSLEELGQLLWAGQGITGPEGQRTSPSAGALFPLELYVVVSRVEDLAAGLYHYRPEEHILSLIATGLYATPLCRSALEQTAIEDAAATLVIAAVYERTEIKYGRRARRYIDMEAGHVAQNLLLQATALGLGSVPIAAFDDAGVKALLRLAAEPLYLLPIGKKS